MESVFDNYNNTMRTGAKYYNYRTKQVLKVGMLSFVEDCNLSNTGEQYETLKEFSNEQKVTHRYGMI